MHPFQDSFYPIPEFFPLTFATRSQFLDFVPRKGDKTGIPVPLTGDRIRISGSGSSAPAMPQADAGVVVAPPFWEMMGGWSLPHLAGPRLPRRS